MSGGDVERIAAFWACVQRKGDSECWPWIGRSVIKKDGRGVFYYKGFRSLAPRFAWEIHHGHKPLSGLFVCHSCDNPSCCNPAHLWLGTNSDNMKDMYRKGRNNPASQKCSGWQKALTHCKRGHEFNAQNTMINSHGNRRCRECDKILSARYRQKRLAVRTILERNPHDRT